MVSTTPSTRSKTLKATLNAMSDAAKIHRQFSVGKPMNSMRNAREAVWMAKALNQQLRLEMTKAGLLPEDVFVHLAYMTPDLTILSTLQFITGQEEIIYEELTGAGKCAIMVGLIFGIRERDPNVLKKLNREDEGVWLLGQKPFFTAEPVRSALSQRIAEGDTLQIRV
jgi:hypothetical protein